MTEENPVDIKQEKKGSGKIKEIKRLSLSYMYDYFNILIIIAVIIVLLVGYFYVIRPKYEVISKNLEITNSERENTKTDLNNLLNSINRYKSSFNKVNQKDRERIDVMLPEEMQKDELLVLMEETVKRKGLILSSLSIVEEATSKKSTKNSRVQKTKKPDETVLPERIGVAKISMSIKGTDYDAFIDFLEEIENSLRLMDIESLDFKPNGKTLSLDINTYYLK